MKSLHAVAFILTVIGGLNWGLVGLGAFLGASGGWNVVNMLLGNWMVLENLVYVVVGLSAVYLVTTHKKDCRQCSAGSSSAPMSSGM